MNIKITNSVVLTSIQHFLSAIEMLKLCCCQEYSRHSKRKDIVLTFITWMLHGRRNNHFLITIIDALKLSKFHRNDTFTHSSIANFKKKNHIFFITETAKKKGLQKIKKELKKWEMFSRKIVLGPLLLHTFVQ